MDKYGQHIVLAADNGHIVLEFGGVHLTASASQHIDNVIFQTFVVHLDVVGNGIVAPCLAPEAAAATAVIMDKSVSLHTDEPHKVWLDRPFVYMIVDTATGLPVFMGTVTGFSE